MQLAARFDDVIDMRLAVEEFGIERPEAREGRIVELEAPVGSEQRDALAQIVERLALHADHFIVAALELDFLGGILIEIGDAAERMLLADDMQRAAVRQIPPGFARLERRIGLQLPGLPVAVIGLFGQPPQLAQAVEDLAVGGPGRQPVGIERPQFGIGRVVEAQSLVGAEDGDGGVELVERAGMRLDMALQFLLRVLERGRRRWRSPRALGEL